MLREMKSGGGRIDWGKVRWKASTFARFTHFWCIYPDSSSFFFMPICL